MKFRSYSGKNSSNICILFVIFKQKHLIEHSKLIMARRRRWHDSVDFQYCRYAVLSWHLWNWSKLKDRYNASQPNTLREQFDSNAFIVETNRFEWNVHFIKLNQIKEFSLYSIDVDLFSSITDCRVWCLNDCARRRDCTWNSTYYLENAWAVAQSYLL